MHLVQQRQCSQNGIPLMFTDDCGLTRRIQHRISPVTIEVPFDNKRYRYASLMRDTPEFERAIQPGDDGTRIECGIRAQGGKRIRSQR